MRNPAGFHDVVIPEVPGTALPARARGDLYVPLTVAGDHCLPGTTPMPPHWVRMAVRGVRSCSPEAGVKPGADERRYGVDKILVSLS